MQDDKKDRGRTLEVILLTDPRSKKNNRAVTQFTVSRNMQRVLARVEVHYSNSMIESLFRMLKNNYLYHQDIRNIEDLERKARFYFTQHNEVIPQATLKGLRRLSRIENYGAPTTKTN
jgi:transposase InsO family protein